jgi:hypothetical protein
VAFNLLGPSADIVPQVSASGGIDDYTSDLSNIQKSLVFQSAYLIQRFSLDHSITQPLTTDYFLE